MDREEYRDSIKNGINDLPIEAVVEFMNKCLERTFPILISYTNKCSDIKFRLVLENVRNFLSSVDLNLHDENLQSQISKANKLVTEISPYLDTAPSCGGYMVAAMTNFLALVINYNGKLNDLMEGCVTSCAQQSCVIPGDREIKRGVQETLSVNLIRNTLLDLEDIEKKYKSSSNVEVYSECLIFFIDILGFRNIVDESKNARSIKRKIELFNLLTENILSEKKIEIKHIYFSDTAIMFVNLASLNDSERANVIVVLLWKLAALQLMLSSEKRHF